MIETQIPREAASSLHPAVLFLLAMILSTLIWMGFWLWRIDKFLVVLAIGSERMALYGYPPDPPGPSAAQPNGPQRSNAKRKG